jgi:multimeric flavodoxin WrbA
MKIVVLNGSPKGEHSITLQYLRFLERSSTEHEFVILHISRKIKKLEKDEGYFNEIIGQVNKADMVLWVFGLWVLAVPAQYMRFIELINERKAESAFRDKYTAAISTSIQFYDHTAHNYMRAICEDLEMKYIDGISFYIYDFMKEDKRNDLLLFFQNLVRTQYENLPTSRLFTPIKTGEFKYMPALKQGEIRTDKKVVILTDRNESKSNLSRMITRFASCFIETPEIIDLNSIHIKGACLGCMKCGYDYNCHYDDGFRDFYNNKVRKADILVLAGSMSGRYLSSLWKTFFDRAFFWNHTPSLYRKQIAYIISGPISQNHNLVQILEANVTARQSANLVDIISDESADSEKIDGLLDNLALRSVRYAEEGFVRPQNFLGVGGHKIFRDEIFGHIRSVWQADHRYYRKNGYYDFEQKKYGLRIMNFFLLSACRIPGFRKKYYDGIMKFPAKRYGRLMDKLFEKEPVPG